MAALVADVVAEADDEARRRHGGWPVVFVGRRRPARIFDKPELAPEEKRAGVADTTARDARLATITKGMADEQYLSRPATTSTCTSGTTSWRVGLCAPLDLDSRIRLI